MMPSRNLSVQSSKRRKHSLGNLRRAYPASGASWNVQVVRGKMSSKCLWHACRALILGLVLMTFGAGTAVIGYYADQLSVTSEVRGNSTIRVKNEAKVFHLNNFSYVGPIVMGFGGFIVVASCVMTFEARDSAAKVMPARPKTISSSNSRSNPNSATAHRRANGTILHHQTTRWDHHLGVFRSSPSEPQQELAVDRESLTAAFIHFSLTIGNTHPRLSPKLSRPSFSGSVPNLSAHTATSANLTYLLSPIRKIPHSLQNRRHRSHHHCHSHQSNNGRHLKSRGARVSNSLVQRSTHEATASLLKPIALHKHHWHATSIDETGRVNNQLNRINDRTKRSDTAKRHVLARQKPIENEEEKRHVQSPAIGKRRSSTMSNSSYSEQWTCRCLSITSRTPSLDSRKIQVDLHNPETQKLITRSPKWFNSGQSSTPSVEREFRSQLSVCSEPSRQLSGQSSLEPCVLEECPEHDEKLQTPICSDGSRIYNIVTNAITKDKPTTKTITPITTITNTTLNTIGILRISRPETLKLCEEMDRKNNPEINKLLHRSNSSLTFYRPKTKIDYGYGSVFFISSEKQQQAMLRNDNEMYGSLSIINERRTRILKTESESNIREKTSYNGPREAAAATTTSIERCESAETARGIQDTTF